MSPPCVSLRMYGPPCVYPSVCMSLHVHSPPYVCSRRVNPSVCMSLRVYDPSCALPLCMHVPSVYVLSVCMSLCMSVPSVCVFLCIGCSFICMSPPCIFSFVCTSLRVHVAVGMQACGDVMIMIGQHGRSVHDLYPHILWGKGDSHFSS